MNWHNCCLASHNSPWEVCWGQSVVDSTQTAGSFQLKLVINHKLSNLFKVQYYISSFQQKHFLKVTPRELR